MVDNSADTHSEHHIVSPKVYFTIFAALMVCTFLTVEAAKVDLNAYFNGLNIIVALVIATFKASLVVLFFMHVKGASEKLTGIVVFSGFFFLGILLTLSLADFLTRTWR